MKPNDFMTLLRFVARKKALARGGGGGTEGCSKQRQEPTAAVRGSVGTEPESGCVCSLAACQVNRATVTFFKKWCKTNCAITKLELKFSIYIYIQGIAKTI